MYVCAHICIYIYIYGCIDVVMRVYIYTYIIVCHTMYNVHAVVAHICMSCICNCIPVCVVYWRTLDLTVCSFQYSGAFAALMLVLLDVVCLFAACAFCLVIICNMFLCTERAACRVPWREGSAMWRAPCRRRKPHVTGTSTSQNPRVRSRPIFWKQYTLLVK